jgi:hypothetical protein
MQSWCFVVCLVWHPHNIILSVHTLIQREREREDTHTRHTHTHTSCSFCKFGDRRCNRYTPCLLTLVRLFLCFFSSHRLYQPHGIVGHKVLAVWSPSENEGLMEGTRRPTIVRDTTHHCHQDIHHCLQVLCWTGMCT